MKTKTFIIGFLILIISSSFVIYTKTKKSNLIIKPNVKINWPKPKLKPVKAKFNASISGFIDGRAKNLDFQTKNSELIVIGRIEKISDYRVNPLVGKEWFAMVYRDAAIVIEQILKGKYDEPYVTVRIYGGKLSDDKEVEVEGEKTEYKLGQRVLIFLKKPNKWLDVEDGIPHYDAMPSQYTKFDLIGNEAVRGPYELPLMPIEKAREEEKGLDTYLNEFLPVDESRFPLDKLLAEIRANL